MMWKGRHLKLFECPSYLLSRLVFLPQSDSSQKNEAWGGFWRRGPSTYSYHPIFCSWVWSFFLRKTLVGEYRKKVFENGWALLIERLWQSLKSNFSCGSPTNWNEERRENDSDNNYLHNEEKIKRFFCSFRNLFRQPFFATGTASTKSWKKDFVNKVHNFSIFSWLEFQEGGMVKSFSLGWLNITKIEENIRAKTA